MNQVLVANESDQPVWFDEVSLQVQPSMIVQETHYDPWGVELAGFERRNNPEHDYKFQDKELVDELGLYWMDFGARYYDPVLGRWHVPDPVDQFGSPYIGMGNNPVVSTDPDGRALPFLAIVAIGAAIGGGANLWANWKHVKTFGDGAKFFAWGAVVGGSAVVAGAALAPVIGTGAIAGGTIGATSGTVLTAGNILLGGGNGDKAGRQIWQSALFGGIGGAVISGTLATLGGRNFFTGAKPAIPGQTVPKPTWRIKDAENITTKEFWKYGRNLPQGRVEPGKAVISQKQDPDGWDIEFTKKLYRGTTGNESMDRLLYFADDPEYAVGYIRNGGTLFEYKMPYNEFQEHILTGAIDKLRGINSSTGQSGIEYLIRDPKLKQDILNQLFKQLGN